MKIISIIFIVFGIILLLFQIGVGIFGSYSYDKNIYSYWTLADKSSTIEAKSEYIDKFVEAIENSGSSGNNAIFLKTPDNSFEKNFSALKTLQSRLEQIKRMDIDSFEYQQAISQITQQEQGEAKSMLENIRGVWKISHFPLIITWNWIGIVYFAFYLLLIGFGGIFIDASKEQ